MTMKVEQQVTAHSLNKKAVPSCSKCGSSNVRVEAFATWNERLQNWRVAEIIESNQVCADCGQDCDIKWRLAA